MHCGADDTIQLLRGSVGLFVTAIAALAALRGAATQCGECGGAAV